MRHFPIYIDLKGASVVVIGGGETALAKLRLLLKTEAEILVIDPQPASEIAVWAASGKLSLRRRLHEPEDLEAARLVYAASGEALRDAEAAAAARAAGCLVNIADDREGSDFITPAIVDRDPVTLAIGTEGTAPLLARSLKRELEDRLPAGLGALARHGAAFRESARVLPAGRSRRAFWSRYFDGVGPRVLAEAGEEGLPQALESLLEEVAAGEPPRGRVELVGAGPGDPELLTLKARRLLHEADVVIHDRLVGPRILELARREARLIEVGKVPGSPSWKQPDINALMIEEARGGKLVVRLKSGDPGIFGRADEEMDALAAAGIAYGLVPGITAAAAAAASAGISMTRRGRNRSIALITAHDAGGFAELDWRALAAEDSAFAIYMGVGAARFLQGRLLLHGASHETPVTVVENASRPEERIVCGTLTALPEMITANGIKGPAIIFVGLAPRAAIAEAEAAAVRLQQRGAAL